VCVCVCACVGACARARASMFSLSRCTRVCVVCSLLCSFSLSSMSCLFLSFSLSYRFLSYVTLLHVSKLSACLSIYSSSSPFNNSPPPFVSCSRRQSTRHNHCNTHCRHRCNYLCYSHHHSHRNRHAEQGSCGHEASRMA